MVGRLAGEDVFRDRLNELYAESGERLTNRKVMEALKKRGFKISEPYLSQLRSGVRGYPSNEVMSAIAEYFNVSPDYFYTIPCNGDRMRVQSENAKIIDRLSDPSMKKLLTMVNGLPEDLLELLEVIALRLKGSENCNYKKKYSVIR
ncbi:helix-turn-helix transcriptional regulator [Rhodococcus erythropolis]|uniref:Helix-turn-helix transcriptional regulator n=1 Tax=Rhodococcus erythropolis TaxID=1833 RepID=A0AAX4A035_RHOER|nr:helix-turn-helix transcriptional regulator [Rhodococcus erythropolis]WMN01894.1 helix-turn-helix transcriptional regulator [Rhodococcus erythropolis]WMN03180.1 helix-turn-helix transcriptional regulator [Rhodococcus erythropolis]